MEYKDKQCSRLFRALFIMNDVTEWKQTQRHLRTIRKSNVIPFLFAFLKKKPDPVKCVTSILCDVNTIEKFAFNGPADAF